MIKGTTPSITCEIEGINLADYDWIHVTMAQANLKKTWKSEDGDLTVNGNTVTFYLGQKDTLAFRSGSALIQFNCGSDDGHTRHASCTQKIEPFCENLEDEVIENI